MNRQPPIIAKWILKKLTGNFIKYSLLGDFDEVYNSISKERGNSIANLWYWVQVLKSFPSLIYDKVTWGIIMFLNYAKLTIRNLLKNKLTSFINIFGLSIAIGMCIFAYLFYDFTYHRDTFHENAENIFLIESIVENANETRKWAHSPLPLGPALKNDFEQVNLYVRLNTSKVVVRNNDDVFYEWATFADVDFFNMFTFPFEYGSEQNFGELNTVILSYKTSQKYFDDFNPVGKEISITLPNAEKESFIISGVTKDFPKDASFAFDMIINFSKQKDFLISDFNDWNNLARATFIRVDDNSKINSIASSMSKYIDVQNSTNYERQVKEFQFEPLLNMAQNAYKVRGTIVPIRLFPGQTFSLFFSGLFLLLLACFNYMNISIVSATGRLKEIGIRKVIGGSRKNLIFQFLGENLLICFIAIIIGLILTKYFFAPSFNALFNVFSFEVIIFENEKLLLFLAALLLLTGLGSGAYPAFFISSFQPANILQGKTTLRSKNRFTKSLLTFQFVISFLLLINGIVMIQNAEYQKTRDWGYDSNQAIVVPLENSSQFTALSNSVNSNTNIIYTSGSVHHVGRSRVTISIESQLNNYEVVAFRVGHNYTQTMGIELIDGHSFSKEKISEAQNSIIVNETFINTLSINDPIGKKIIHNEQAYLIAGVAKDFHYSDFMKKIEPVIFFKSSEDEFNYFIARSAQNKAVAAESVIESSWRELFPDSPYRGYFQDAIFDGYKNAMESVAKMMGFIAVTSLFITCMGIFGLVSLNIKKRIKEMSIRKVLGASSFHITKLINQDFSILLAIAIIFAIPLSIYLINLFINSLWKYHTELSSIHFIITSALIVLTAIGTILVQVLKTLKRNPVDNLRSE